MFQASSRARRGNGPSDIVDHVDRSPRKKAQQIWVLVGVVLGLVTMLIASEYTHPILAAILGGLTGFVIGGLCALFIYVWPIVRYVWWWLPEITVVVLLTAGWMNLAQHTTLPVRVVVIAVIVGVPALIKPLREAVVALAWCFIIRHRIRKCFTNFIVVGRFDPEPFIFGATPTKAGVTCVVLLRAGVSIEDIQAVSSKITTTCWAKEVTVSHTKDTNKAWVRFDVTRKNTFTDTIDSPLTGEIATDVPALQRAVTEAPTDLDYSDVTADDIKDEHQPEKPARKSKNTKPVNPDANGTVTGPGGNDITDWI
ncbi:MAG: hypothetical protein GEV10_09750 [Streptosporangiales bacterium]|nr:hypothetical protein [Streptosporangiales bacterium]